MSLVERFLAKIEVNLIPLVFISFVFLCDKQESLIPRSPFSAGSVVILNIFFIHIFFLYSYMADDASSSIVWIDSVNR